MLDKKQNKWGNSLFKIMSSVRAFHLMYCVMVHEQQTSRGQIQSCLHVNTTQGNVIQWDVFQENIIQDDIKK